MDLTLPGCLISWECSGGTLLWCGQFLVDMTGPTDKIKDKQRPGCKMRVGEYLGMAVDKNDLSSLATMRKHAGGPFINGGLLDSIEARWA